MANIFMRFPGGRDKALTLSYDDAVKDDKRLVGIMQKYGLKGTFNINTGCYAPEGDNKTDGRLTKTQAFALYKDSGMEIALHAVTHPFLEKLPVNICNYEVLQDRINLEEDFDCIVRGMAYPYGTFSDDVVEVLRSCGIAYSRTTKSTEKFDIPTDWLRMPATCHHKNPRLMELANTFLNEPDRYGRPRLFYMWGHSYEFGLDNNWNVIEDFAELMGNRKDVWYATNIEIYDYVKAYESLVFSVVSKKVYNPSCTDIYFFTEGKVYCVKRGETLKFE